MTEAPRILIIDDNPDDRALVMRELNRDFEDVEFIEVIDGDGFKNALSKGDFDLVITDYRIRWTTGLKVLEKVKDRYPDCPVIMFTGTGNEEIVVQAMKGGLDDYVVKTSSHFVRLPASVRSILERKEEREALRRAEEVYERLFENIPMGLYCVRMNGDVVAVNKAMVDMLDYPDKTTLLQTNVGDTYVDPDERDEWLDRLKKEKTVQNYETKLKTYDGSEIWVKNNAHVVSDEDGSMIFIEGSMEDITDRKKAQMALDDEKDRIKRLHDTANLLEKCSTEEEVYEHTIEAAKNIMEFNSSSILMNEGDDLVIEKSSNQYLVKGTRSPIEKGICGKTFREQETFLVEDIRDWPEAEPARKEYRSAISVPIGDMGVFQVISNQEGYFDENDKVHVEILASHALEALRRIRYENELKEKEELYRTIFENSGTAIAIIEDDMTASMVNKRIEQLTGYTREELVRNKKWTEFVVKDDSEEMMDLHRLRREDPEAAPFNYFFKFINRYGDTRDMLVNVAMIPGTKKSLISLLDITQNLKTLRAFEESQEMFRITFDNTDQGIALLDLQGNILEVNDAFCGFIGYSEQELANKDIDDLFSEKGYCKEEIEEIAAGERKSFEARAALVKKDGEVVKSDITVSAVKDSDGRLRQMLAFVKEPKEEGI